MLKIRLQRIGRKNDPRFRVVVIESTKGPKSGNFIEMLGSYDPHKNTTTLNGERITHWMSHGAQVSGTVHNILINEKIITGKKINVLPKKSPIVKEKKEEEIKAVEDVVDADKGSTEESFDSTQDDSAESNDADTKSKTKEPAESNTEEKKEKTDKTSKPKEQKEEIPKIDDAEGADEGSTEPKKPDDAEKETENKDKKES